MKNRFKHAEKFLLLIIIVFIGISACKTKSRKLTPKEHEAFKENLVKANRGLVDLDQDKIKTFAKRRNWEMQVSETGMWYQILESESGKKAQAGLVAHLKYKVSLLDGTMCYTSDSLGNMVFKIGQGGVESGLEEAILMMKIGDKGRFIMPPHLAHGLLGDENKIPSRTIIVYQTELLNLTKY